MAAAPYGTWPSPVTPALLVEAAVGLSNVTLEGGRVYWVESRPSEAGRVVLMAAPAAGGSEPVEVTPAGFSVRTRVHEYGGRCYCVHGSTIVFSNWADQRLWVIRGGADPVPLTAGPQEAGDVRFADPVFSPDGRWVACVRETHHGADAVVNDLVAVPVDSPGAAPVLLAGGHDFFAAPRFSPDGSRLCWVSWELPDMPWDSTWLWCAEVGADLAVGPARHVAGGPGSR